MANVMLKISTFPCILKNYSVIHPLRLSACSYCTAPNLEAQNDARYPEPKPRVPENVHGGWGRRSKEQAWALHDISKNLLKIANVRDRLDKITWQNGKTLPLWQVHPIDIRPGTLEYKQYITRTHVVDGFPENVYHGVEEEASALTESLASQFQAVVSHEHELDRGTVTGRYTSAKNMCGQFVNMIYGALAPDRDHLLRSQLDENARIESFWWKGGYGFGYAGHANHNVKAGLIMNEAGVTGKKWIKRKHGLKENSPNIAGRFSGDIVQFQVKTKASYQIRMEKPLPEYVSLDDPLCQGGVPIVPYAPKTLLQFFKIEKPFSINASWIGDPCEFNLMSMHVLDSQYDEFVGIHGKALAEEEFVNYALVAGFANSASQAYTQGFSMHHELTYPIMSQLVVTDGQTFRFAAYQLNTLQQWQHNNKRRNLMFISEPMKLYESVEDGIVRGLNTNVLKHLLRFALIGPTTSAHDLRPFLPNSRSPLHRRTKDLINHVGDEPVHVKKLGRWGKPKFSQYWRQSGRN